MKCMCLNFWNHWRGQHHHARLRFYIFFFLLFWLLSLLLLLFVRSLVWSLDKRKFVVQRTYVAIARPDFAPKWTEVLSGECSFPCKCVMFFGRKWQNVSFFAVGRSFRFLLLRFAVKKWLFFFHGHTLRVRMLNERTSTHRIQIVGMLNYECASIHIMTIEAHKPHIQCTLYNRIAFVRFELCSYVWQFVYFVRVCVCRVMCLCSSDSRHRGLLLPLHMLSVYLYFTWWGHSSNFVNI